jgi:hypothetical protein
MLLLAMVPLAGCSTTGTADADPAAPPANRAASAPGDEQTIPGLRFTPSSAWVQSQAKSPMRVVEYAVPGDGGGDAASLIVYYFGRGGAGTAEANIERWCAQFADSDGRTARERASTEQRTINGMAVRTVDVRGRYVAETFPGSGERVDEPDHRLLAAIVSTGAGPYYIKLVGPGSTVDAAAGAFGSMLASMAPADVPAATALPPGHP